MTGWRKRTIMEMAREAGLYTHKEVQPELEAFAALVREDEAEKYKWDVHSCGPTCTKVGCVAVRKAVKAEREACAVIADGQLRNTNALLTYPPQSSAAYQIGVAIRARGDQA